MLSSLYANESVFQIIFVTVVIGCGCAWMTGRAIARTWRSAWVAVAAMLGLGLVVRFFHFALFDEHLVAPATYAFETAWLIVTALLAWRFTRTQQMVRQYYWLYEPAGPLGWKLRQDVSGKAP